MLTDSAALSKVCMKVYHIRANNGSKLYIFIYLLYHLNN